VPAIPSWLLEPLWDQFAALLPGRPVYDPAHPLGCHRPRIPDCIIFEKLIQVLRFGCPYQSIADCTWLMPRTFLNKEARWFPDGSLAELPDIDADPGAFDIRRFAPRPGDAVFFDFLTVHGAPGFPIKPAAGSCPCAICRRVPGTHRAPGAPPPPFDDLHAELPAGTAMDHPLFPVVWPADPAD
jgi:hypothetical protein